MRIVLNLAFLCVIAASSAVARDDSTTVEGVLYVTYDMGVGNGREGKLSARFVPGTATLAAPAGGPDSAQPVHHFTIDNPSKFAVSLVGKSEVARLSKDLMRVVAVPVTAVLTHRRRIVECDAPADYATFVSVKARAKGKPVSRDVAPIGC